MCAWFAVFLHEELLCPKAAAVVPCPCYLRDKGTLWMMSRAIIAKRRLTDILHINTPLLLSDGPNSRKSRRRIRSLQPTVE
jgi:hypothetical protein